MPVVPNPYHRLIELTTLTEGHREELRTKRGLSSPTIDALRFRSAGEHLAKVLIDLQSEFSADQLRSAGLLTEELDPAPALLRQNILIPYIDWDSDQVTMVRAHKEHLHGIPLSYYLAQPITRSVIVLTEGEFKAAACREWNLEAIAIPGVGSFAKTHFPRLISFLRAHGMSTVYIAFDNEIKSDPAYPNYKPDPRNRWDTQYHAYQMAKKLVAEGVSAVVATLPAAWMQNGKIDLDGALAQGKTKEDLGQVLRAAVDPDRYLRSLPKEAQEIIREKYAKSHTIEAVTTWGNHYCIHSDNGPMPVSNFILQPVSVTVLPDGTLMREMEIVSDVGEHSAPFLFDGETLSAVPAFRAACLSRGNFMWSGTQKQLQTVLQYEQLRDPGRRIYQPDRVGWIEEAQLYLFGNMAINGSGSPVKSDGAGTVWKGLTGFRAASLAKAANQDEVNLGIPRISEEPMDPYELAVALQKKFDGAEGVKLALAWVVACLFSHDLSGVYNPVTFPVLFLAGMSRSGKSTLAHWLLSVAGMERDDAHNYQRASTVGIERALAYYSSLPVIFDEFRIASSNQDREKEALIRAAYNRQAGLKGLRSSYGVRGTLIRGCLAVCGEDTPKDPATLQRLVIVALRRRPDLEGAQLLADTAEYNRINAMAYKMSGIIPVCCERYNSRKEKVIEAIRAMREKLIKEGVDDRTSINYAIVAGVYDQIVKENDSGFLLSVIDQARFSFADKKTEDPTDLFIDALQRLRASGDLNDQYIRVYEDKYLAIYYYGVVGLWKEKLARSRDELAFKERTVLEYFVNEPYFVEKNKPVRIGRQTVRALILDPTKDDRLLSLLEAM